MSHLRAIEAAYDAGVQAALIIEDDISLQYVPEWDSTLADLVVSAPPDWDVLQLHTNNPEFYLDNVRLPCGGVEAEELWVPWDTSHWSTLTYLINRHGMAKLLNATQRGTRLPSKLAADEVLYMVPTTYTLARPLFTARTEFTSSVQTASAVSAEHRATTETIESTTDGPTGRIVDAFYSLRKKANAAIAASASSLLGPDGTRGVCTPDVARWPSIALIATVSSSQSELKRHTTNAAKLGGASWRAAGEGAGARARWTYAINAIDNQVEPWLARRDEFASHGVLLLAAPSGRAVPRFQSKLIGQLALFGQLQKLLRTDYGAPDPPASWDTSGTPSSRTSWDTLVPGTPSSLGHPRPGAWLEKWAGGERRDGKGRQCSSAAKRPLLHRARSSPRAAAVRRRVRLV
eukprot:6317280-Prymnesium_polylepis.1